MKKLLFFLSFLYFTSCKTICNGIIFPKSVEECIQEEGFTSDFECCYQSIIANTIYGESKYTTCKDIEKDLDLKDYKKSFDSFYTIKDHRHYLEEVKCKGRSYP